MFNPSGVGGLFIYQDPLIDQGLLVLKPFGLYAAGGGSVKTEKITGGLTKSGGL
jgi:hypothetical protein